MSGVALLCALSFTACGSDSSTAANDTAESCAATESSSSITVVNSSSSGATLSSSSVSGPSSSSSVIYSSSSAEIVSSSSSEVVSLSSMSSSSKEASSSSESSSSSEVPSSSSVSSSSEVISSSSDKAAWAYLNPTINYGEITDPRDNQVYKTVVIGTQTWMAENLNYDTLNGTGSWCYENRADSCAKYGRLYPWATAMDLDPSYNDKLWNDSNVKYRGICPAGWHLPDTTEWKTLYDYVDAHKASERVGISLETTTGWSFYKDVAGTDEFGFSALPAGHYFDEKSKSVGSYGDFWTSTAGGQNYASSRDLDYFGYFTRDDYYIKSSAISVRCLRD